MKKERLIIAIFSLMFFISILFTISIVIANEEIKCYNDANCDDDNPYTYDECINPGSITSQCIYENIKCLSDSDCGNSSYELEKFCFIEDLFRNFKSSVCVNPESIDSYCNINIEPKFYTDCGEDYCENYQDSYCIDRNAYHDRNCYDRGCSDSNCFSNKIVEKELVKECELGCLNGTCVECSEDSDCNPDYFNEPYCNGLNRNELFHDLIDYSCVNKKCVINTQNVFIKNCGTNTCKEYGINYCKGNDVYQNRTCYEQGCSINQCYNNTVVEEKLYKKCYSNEKCFNGNCELNECSKDSDCDDFKTYTFDICNITNGIGKCINIKINCFKDLDCGKNKFTGDQFCQEDKNIFKNFLTYKCINPGTINSICNVTTSPKFIIGCGENFYSDGYCRNNNVYWNFINNTCFNGGICSKKVTQQLKENCLNGCYNGYCKECGEDSDCAGKNSCSEYSSEYCEGNSVYKNRTCDKYTCFQYRCLKEKEEDEIWISDCKNTQICQDGICEDNLTPFEIISPVENSTHYNKVTFVIKIADSINPRRIKYTDETLNQNPRTLCTTFKNKVCQKTVSFKDGYHTIRLDLINKSGEVYTKRIGFTIN